MICALSLQNFTMLSIFESIDNPGVNVLADEMAAISSAFNGAVSTVTSLHESSMYVTWVESWLIFSETIFFSLVNCSVVVLMSFPLLVGRCLSMVLIIHGYA